MKLHQQRQISGDADNERHSFDDLKVSFEQATVCGCRLMSSVTAKFVNAEKS